MAADNKVEIRIDTVVTGQPGIDRLTGSLKDIAPAADGAGKSASIAGKGIDAIGAAAVKADGGVEAAKKSLGGIGTAAEQAHKQIAQLAQGLLAGWSFKELTQAAAQMETLRAGLTAVTGSAEKAGAEMEFVRGIAVRSGVDIADAARAFLGLAAATKGTAVEGEPTRQVFEAVASAMAKAGKSSAETQNALLALSQIASKGTVSMEELRGQLGEALPGALQAAANGLGITTQDLIKLVESGQIAAQDLFPALSKGLKDIYGTAPAAQTLAQEITNIKNSFVEMADHLGQAGGLDALKLGAEAAQTAIVYLDDSLVMTGKTIGAVAAAIANWDFSGLKQAFADIEAESRDKLLKAAQHNSVMAASIRAGGTEAAKMALQVQEAGTASAKAAEAAATASPKYIELANAYTKVREELKGQIEQAEKNLAARSAEAKQIEDHAKLFGTEADARNASAKAAAIQAEASERLASIIATEVGVMRAELDAKKATLEADGKISDQRKKELKDLQDLIDKRQADAEKATAQATASRNLAESAKLEIEKHKDNSARLGELASAYETARKKLEEVQRQKVAGLATDAQVAAADREAAKAAALYRDALSDVVTKLTAKKAAAVAEANATITNLNAQKELYKQAEALAELDGNTQGVREAKIAQLKIEIELIKAKAAVMRAEAEGAIAVAEAKLAELRASGQLDAVKEAELKASITLAKAKINEADVTERGITLQQRMIEKLEDAKGAQDRYGRSISETTAALEAQNAELERQVAAQEKANDLAERATALENKRLNRDKQGFGLDDNGNRRTSVSESRTSVYNTAKQAGLSDDDAYKIAQQFISAEGRRQGGKTPTPGVLGDPWAMGLAEAIQAKLEEYRRKAADDKANAARASLNNGNGAANTPSSATIPADSASAATAKTVNVRLLLPSGATQNIATDDAGAAALLAALKEAKLSAAPA